MRFDARLGIAGAVAMSNQTINVADAYEHPLFYKEVDIQTGYRTRTLLAVPIHSLDGSVIGVGEAANKMGGLFHPRRRGNSQHHRRPSQPTSSRIRQLPRR